MGKGRHGVDRSSPSQLKGAVRQVSPFLAAVGVRQSGHRGEWVASHSVGAACTRGTYGMDVKFQSLIERRKTEGPQGSQGLGSGVGAHRYACRGCGSGGWG